LNAPWYKDSLLFLLVPGVVVLGTDLGVPPGERVVFSAVTEALGVLMFVLLRVNRVSISTLKKKHLTIVSSALALTGILFLVIYLFVYELTVIKHPIRGDAYFPLILNGQLEEMVVSAGSRMGAIEKYGIDAVKDAIEVSATSFASKHAFATAILLLLYQLIFLPLAAAYGIVSVWRKGTTK